MADAAAASLHLKLDRVLAELGALSAKQEETEEAVSALTAGLELLRGEMGDTRAAVEALAEAADAGGGGELNETLTRIHEHLEQIAADGDRMVTVINGLPRAMSDAAMDAVRLALGEAVDVGGTGGAA